MSPRAPVAYVPPELAGVDRDALVVKGVTVGAMLDANRRPPTPAGCRYRAGVVYGRAGDPPRDLRLHLYSHRDGGSRPAAVLIHGGCWVGGHPFNHARRAAALAARGWVTASIEYRLAPAAPWPAALEDCKCAVRWMRANAQRLGVDPERIVVIGDSAGGHLAAMVGLTPGMFEGDGGARETSSSVAAMVLLYPITDLCAVLALTEQRDQFVPGGDERTLRDASPLTWVRAGAPPSLIISGDSDSLVPVENSLRLHDALVAAGATSQLEIYAGRDHGFEIDPADAALTQAVVEEFLAEVVPATGRPS